MAFLAKPRHSTGERDWSALIKGERHHFGDCAGREPQFCSGFPDFAAEVSQSNGLEERGRNTGAGDFAELSATSSQLLARGRWNRGFHDESH
jgi:hypothetical protein